MGGSNLVKGRAPEAVSPTEARAALDRTVKSSPFRGARNLTAFLSFVVERTLEGRADEVKEYTVGVEVLGRGQDFDPRADGVVRVQAGQLRKKLDAYYRDEGKGDPVRIEIPKGGYVPRFVARAAAPATESPTPRLPSSPFPRVKVASLMVASGLLGMWLAPTIGGQAPTLVGHSKDQHAASGVDHAVPLRSKSPLWEPFFDAPGGAVLALGVPQFFSADGLFVRDINVNEPTPGGARLQAIADQLQKPLQDSEVYTGLGEAAGAVALARFFGTNRARLRILRSRLVGWDSLRELPVVFLASMRFHTLADELDLPRRFGLDEGGQMVDRGGRVAAPAVLPVDDNLEYGTITGIPGRAPDRRVLILQGRSTWATQGIAEYLTDETALADLAAKLGRGGTWPNSFEVLVAVEIRDSQPMRTRYVAHQSY